MDSKVVSRAIKAEVWPLLRDAGFSVFSPRTAWRQHFNRVDVFSFQSFNAYNAGVIGCTTSSFSVRLGCFLLVVPPEHAPSRLKSKGGVLIPHEHECQFRGSLARTFQQPELERTDIWYVSPDGASLSRSIQDVRTQYAAHAAPWYAQFGSLEHVLDILEHRDEDMDRLWGFGRNPSPMRSYLSGYVARALGQGELARARLASALQSGCFPQFSEQLAVHAAET
ncbi:MAG: hypothetical protein LPK85_11245 [Gammaproteobacteria bacterium]|nr:hypothetical protein [Gammaproteobacteria bacterium]